MLTLGVAAEREDYSFRSGQYRNRGNYDDRRYDGYHDDRRGRYDRSSHYDRREPEFSPLRYSDGSLPDNRSSSPDRSRRTPSSDIEPRTSNELKLSGLPKDNRRTISEETVRKPILHFPK